jgi:hypothetical protein
VDAIGSRVEATVRSRNVIAAATEATDERGDRDFSSRCRDLPADGRD